ncbi:MAG: hypothetical protein R2792_01030 [Saprospiraceae bacterium]
MSKNEEYVPNKGRDLILFLGSAVFMVVLLMWKPEWVWVSWPLLFTSLAGFLNRL